MVKLFKYGLLIILFGLFGCATTRVDEDIWKMPEEEIQTNARVSIKNQTRESDVAEDDVLPGHDTSANAGRGFLVGNVMKVMNDSVSGLSISNANLPNTFQFSMILGDNDYVIDTGVQFQTYFRVPYKHDLNSITLWTTGNAGNITIDVWVDEATGTTNGVDSDVTDTDSLFDVASEPTIADASADAYVEVTSFDASEDTDIPAGSFYVVNVDSVTTLTNAYLIFNCTKKN